MAWLFGRQSPKASQLRLSIPAAHVARPLDNSRAFVTFDVVCSYGASSWSVHHRFAEFKVLSSVLHERYSGQLHIPPLPGENILMHALDTDELVEQQRVGLEAYLRRVSTLVSLEDDCLSAFLGLETLFPPEHADPAALPVAWPAAQPAPPACAPSVSVRESTLGPVAEDSSKSSVPVAGAPCAAPQDECKTPLPLARQHSDSLPFTWSLLWEGSVGHPRRRGRSSGRASTTYTNY